MEIRGNPAATKKFIEMYQDRPKDDILEQEMRR